MPDVRLPDGTIVKNVPDGITQSELMRRVSGVAAPESSGFNTSPMPTSNMGPAPEASMSDMHRQVAAEAAKGDRQIPTLQSESFHEKSIPVLGSLAGLLVPGAGWGALGLQSALSGAGNFAGELFRQQQSRETIDPQTAFKQGATTAVGTAAGGGLIKGLGAIAKKIFSSPLTGPQAAGAQFAREQGAPFPLSSAAPGSSAARTQQATRALLPGDIRTQVDANRVTQFLNSRVGTMTEKAAVFDDAARKGQQFLREVFEPGEVAYKNAFARYAEAVGDEVAIPSTNTLAAAQRASEFLEKRGQTTGGLYQRLRTILKKAPESFTPREFDELYGAVIKQAFTSKAAAGGEGKIILSGIVQDMDEFGKPLGAAFADDIAKASATREAYRELRKIPQLERLAAELGNRQQGGTAGTRDWMNSLFSEGNGKALAKVRELNPELYHELADAWLAKQIDGFSTLSKETMGRSLDGAKMRTWFVQNQPKIKEIFGTPQAKALDNFTLYAEQMTGAGQRSTKGSKGLDPIAIAGRATGEAAGIVKNPFLMIPGEAAAYVLAKGLSDPSSALFKAFTQGFSPATRSFMVKSGELAGQAAAHGQN